MRASTGAPAFANRLRRHAADFTGRSTGRAGRTARAESRFLKHILDLPVPAAAVARALIERTDSTSPCLMTQRAPQLTNHEGQISIPRRAGFELGGRRSARGGHREAREEIGFLDPRLRQLGVSARFRMIRAFSSRGVRIVQPGLLELLLDYGERSRVPSKLQ